MGLRGWVRSPRACTRVGASQNSKNSRIRTQRRTQDGRTALDGPQDEPGGRRLQYSALQGDRRAPATVAAGDELPMNFHETHVL
jgi:hypothetical protein